MDNEMEKEDVALLMGQFMKGIGRIIKTMGKEDTV
jgi:hypothetical protein